MFNNTS